jgi:YhcH/YjgK/YiaL family protein
MIVDDLRAAERYFSLHPGFRAAFEFLRTLEPGTVPGRQEIQGERLFAIIARDQGRGRENALLEAHRRYLDIQYVLVGPDVIGWLPTGRCERVSSPYAADKDIGFFYDRPATWLEIPAGHFAIFYPDDAHAPLASCGAIHKAVVKVAVDWS